jgi:D-serine deaminase-like pyridoxal phosphate-dependent protein
MNAFDLDTPSVYIDLDILEANMRRMQERCRGWKVGLRPHAKTHKIPEIARLQLAMGAIGITVAKIGEAEVMPGADLLIAYNILPDKIPRLRPLLKNRRITVLVDAVEVARKLDGIETLVDVDVGFRRTGVQSPEDYEKVADACTHFRGLFYYPANLDEPTMRRAAETVQACLARRKGEVVSGGSTPSAARTPFIPETTEVRPGSYVFNDAGMMTLGLARPEDCALRVLVSVVSTAVPGQCVIDGGMKTFSAYPTREVGGYGHVVDRPWSFVKMNEEHGILQVADRQPRMGEKLWIIPASASKTIDLHDEVAFGRNGRVEGTWKVAARGKIR